MVEHAKAPGARFQILWTSRSPWKTSMSAASVDELVPDDTSSELEDFFFFFFPAFRIFLARRKDAFLLSGNGSRPVPPKTSSKGFFPALDLTLSFFSFFFFFLAFFSSPSLSFALLSSSAFLSLSFSASASLLRAALGSSPPTSTGGGPKFDIQPSMNQVVLPYQAFTRLTAKVGPNWPVTHTWKVL